MVNRGGRRRRAVPKSERAPGRTVVLQRTARLVRAELRRRQVDLAPVAKLAPTLGVTAETLRAAVARDPDLGICGPSTGPMIWSLPPGPVAAGFEPAEARGRLVLTLPGSASNPHPLIISGRHLGPSAPDADEPAGAGRGELGHTITRLYLMAERWMVLAPAPATAVAVAVAVGRSRQLFELIARTWWTTSSVRWTTGRLQAYQAEHGTPIATRFWAGGAATDQLELVVWISDDGQRHLVNVYPGGTTVR